MPEFLGVKISVNFGVNLPLTDRFLKISTCLMNPLKLRPVLPFRVKVG